MPAIMDREFIEQEQGLDDLVLPASLAEVLEYELASAARGNGFRHTLALAGMGGAGKTSVGFGLAKELGADQVILVSSAPTKSEKDHLLSSIDDGTFLLLDEFHEYCTQAWLLDLLEGARGLGRRVDFVSYAATTNRGQIPQTAQSRFPVKLEFRYTESELSRVADQIASRFGVTLDDTSRTVLLRAAVGNPRTMRSILGFWPAGPENAVRLAQLTVDGLDSAAMEILVFLSDHQRPIGRDTLARSLQSPGGIADSEGILVRRGYLSHAGSAGLRITHDGIKRVRIHREKGV